MAAEITIAEVSDWLTPKAAVKELEPELGTDDYSHIAKNTLLRRLRHGEIRAVAGTNKLYEIPASDWKEIGENDFLWASGDVSFEWFAGSGYNRTQRETTHLSVRFDPEGVRKILPPEAADAEGSQAKQPEPEIEKGPRVTDPHLQIWLDAYQKIYGGTPTDTLTNAVKSARGMLFDKSVARDRVTKLFEGRKPGPKTGG